MKWTSEDYRDKIVNKVEELRKYKTYIIIGLALIITGVIFISSKNNVSKNIELIGPQTISMYQGDIYEELGFKAYDKDNNNYDDEVKIETNLNTEVPGTYEITYKIGKKEVTRTIIVLEKTIQYYEMMLEKINGEETIYLKVNEEYILPGYKILDQDGVDVTEIVEVVMSGEVDITKAGRYILVYEFKNQNEEIITKTREVVVIDNKLEINMSKTTPTNQDITLEIKVEDEYFESLTLPSGEKIGVKEYTYIVDKNGKYKFILNNKHGFNIEKEIEITNIDKEVPTGNCIATRQNGKTIVTVSGNDNIGISKYIIDGVTYTNKDITVNKELQTVKVELLDDAGNKNNIECVAVNKNLSISATPSITSYTNSNVKITVKVESEYFDYIKLPNGTIINNKNYTYEVSTNGTYTFIAYNKDGQSKSVSAVINNIDKQNPTGSCSGSYKDGVSNVIISASDNIGISKYVIDGVTYTSKDIKINKEITNLNVMIYDKANNTYQATCTLEDKNNLVLFDPKITLTYEYIIKEDTMPYGLFTPTGVKTNKKIPLIVTLHGSSEKGTSATVFKNKFLVALFNNWEMEGFNAYVLAPHLAGSGYSGSWSNETSAKNLFNLIDKLVQELNIDSKKIILEGHSLGGQGALYMAAHERACFSAVVPLSGYSSNAVLENIKIPIRGYVGKPAYGEDSTSYNYMKKIFTNILGIENLYEKNVSHDNLPKTVFTEDKNNDNRSDLIEWMFAQ